MKKILISLALVMAVIVTAYFVAPQYSTAATFIKNVLTVRVEKSVLGFGYKQWDVNIDFTDTAPVSQTIDFGTLKQTVIMKDISWAATATGTLSVGGLPTGGKVVAVGFIADVAITGDATDYATLTFYKGDPTGALKIGEKAYDTPTTDDVAQYGMDSAYGTLANYTLAAGNVVTIQKTEANAGMETTGRVFIVIEQ